jgi:uncharacterized membrane protein YfcA
MAIIAIVAIFGIVLIYFGIKLLFQTESILEKFIRILNLDKNSIRYKFVMNKSNDIFYKFTGFLMILMGLGYIIIPIYFKFIRELL